MDKKERIERLDNLLAKIDEEMFCRGDSPELRALQLEVAAESAATYAEPEAWETASKLNDLLWRY